MQIRKLRIDDHKCLVDFYIDFETLYGGSSTILIGENGAGKSTMLNTIVEILMSFDSRAVENRIRYNYELEYMFAGKEVSIIGENRYYRIDVDGMTICNGSIATVRRQLAEYSESIFPERIITFYSGANDQLSWHHYRIGLDYRNACRKAVRQYRNTIMHGEFYDKYMPKRKYNRCLEELTPIYLLAILCGGNSVEKDYLQKNCHYGDIQNVTVSIDTEMLAIVFPESQDPANEPFMEMLIEFLDDRFMFWFHHGFLYQKGKRAYYSLGNFSEVEIDSISIYNFFEKLQMLLDAKCSVHLSVGESRVDCDHLSEGQRQLIKILGMLGICKSEDCLVIMDEPDAHMNPRWKYELKKIIDDSLVAAVNTQALIATHDPLVINGVEKEFVRIFTHNRRLADENGFYFTQVIEPTEDTIGMGIDGLLQSQYYGLDTTLDYRSQDKLEEKRELMVKRKRGELTSGERQRLLELTEELENMAFSRNIPTDNYYDDFVAAIHDIYRTRPMVNFSPEEIEEKNRVLREIAEDLIGI